jgi:glycosyltransferase involved in cell wall biosynthesis
MLDDTPPDVRGVSLVIPLQDEEASVIGLLQSVTAQSRSPDEVIVVDAGSRDGTSALVAQHHASFAIRLTRTDRVYPGSARNAGVLVARHEWIAFTDGGIRLEPTWLSRLMTRAETGAEVVFGTYAPVCDTLWTQASAVAYTAVHSDESGRGPSVASMLIRRRAFLDLGGFPDYRAAEDLVFIERAMNSGLRIAFAPDAIAHWQLAPTPAATYRRFALYSHHNLVAGRGGAWHIGLARLYMGFALFASLASLKIGVWAAAMFPLFFVARAIKAAYRHRLDLPVSTLTPQRVLCTAVVLLVVDVATIAGAIRWIRLADPSRRE